MQLQMQMQMLLNPMLIENTTVTGLPTPSSN